MKVVFVPVSNVTKRTGLGVVILKNMSALKFVKSSINNVNLNYLAVDMPIFLSSQACNFRLKQTV